MDKQQIKDNAPHGATHYDHEIKKYLKLHGNDLHYWCINEGKWIEIHIIFLDIERCSIL